jgi:hypothetical protein
VGREFPGGSLGKRLLFKRRSRMRIRAETVTAIASVVLCIIVAVSVVLVSLEIHASQRQHAIQGALQIVLRWQEVVGRDNHWHANLLLALDPENRRRVFEGLPITLCIDVAKQYMGDEVEKLKVVPGGEDAPDSVVVPSSLVTDIRFTMVSELNVMELIPLAYKYSAADKAMLDEAFYQFFIEEGYVKQCVELMNDWGAPWPAIEELPDLMRPPGERSQAPGPLSILVALLDG